MFDDIYDSVGGGTSYNHTEVHEHRAPTDASVKLLSEMEEKAIQRVVASAVINDNDLTFGYLVLRHSVDSWGYQIRWFFKLNGRDIKGSHDLSGNKWEEMAGDRYTLMNFVREQCVQALAKALFKKLDSETGSFGRRFG